MSTKPVMEYRVVSAEEMAAWPVDRKRSGEKLWAETTWGGDAPGRPKLFNWNIWPCRVLFEVVAKADVVRGEAVWRRSARSIRLKGLKLLSAATGQEVADARLLHYDQERVVIDFRPASGPGLYHLYYAAAEPTLFNPSKDWLALATQTAARPRANALRIEARCELDGFWPMEVVALKSEIEQLLATCPAAPYLVFPEDRDRPIKLLFDIPAHWALDGPRKELALHADRNEYRVFQLGLWACREALENVGISCSELRSVDGKRVIPADRVQCLTLQSRIKSLYIQRPSGECRVPKGQTRALWFGVDLPEDLAPGEYRGTLTVNPPGQPKTLVGLRLIVSSNAVLDKGEHELHRLSRLRWIESDVGLSDEVFPPYQPLRLANGSRAVLTWGHALVLDECGLPEQLLFGREPILARPIELRGKISGKPILWRDFSLRITERTPGHVCWKGTAACHAARLIVDGRIEYDGCIVVDLHLQPLPGSVQARIEELSLTTLWRKEHAALASGMGYRGRRDANRCWRKHPDGATCFNPSIWLGSVKAGMGWVTWETDAWEDVSRPDAATVCERDEGVALQANLGSHGITSARPWHMQFALRPTPVKPPDARHWQFRYIHLGGDFMPSDYDTPQSFLKDNCKRLDELKAMGVRRLNLHDWWGPAFNYPWQWDGPDNLSRLTAEAHKRGIFVKVYNSGRELSTLAPEFWALLYEGAQYRFPEAYDPRPAGNFQDAWHENHLPDGLPQGWPRLSPGYGNEHAVPVSNHTRNGNFYLESMRYMTQHFGTDGAYWDGADGPTLGHREMAKRLWTIFRQLKPEATIDVHHGDAHTTSPITDHMLCFPFIDSLWHGEGFDYERFDPWTWLVEISGLPFNVPSEVLGGEEYFARGMLFGIWTRAGWCAGTEKQRKLWAFFDRFGIEEATLRGWWEQNNGVTVSRPETYVSAFTHPRNGVLLAIATWHQPIAGWMRQTLDVSLLLDRAVLGLPEGRLTTTDVLSDEELDIAKPVPLPDAKLGRLLWVK